jgi:hypothetical protein
LEKAFPNYNLEDRMLIQQTLVRDFKNPNLFSPRRKISSQFIEEIYKKGYSS